MQVLSFGIAEVPYCKSPVLYGDFFVVSFFIDQHRSIYKRNDVHFIPCFCGIEKMDKEGN